MNVIIAIRRIDGRQGNIAALDSIPAACFGMASQTIGSLRKMDSLDSTIHADRHIGCVRNHDAVDLDPLVIFLVADQAVDVLELVL